MSKPAPPPSKTPAPKSMGAAQRAYEERRAGKAGLSLDKHLQAKERRAADDAQKAAPPPPPKKQGILSRFLDRAHQPLKKR